MSRVYRERRYVTPPRRGRAHRTGALWVFWSVLRRALGLRW